MGIRINPGETITLRAEGAELTLAADEIVSLWLAKIQTSLARRHPDDIALGAFTKAMSEKLAIARAKGRSGWNDPSACSVEQLAAALMEHTLKGDPVDVANFAMMLHQRGADFDVLARTASASHRTLPALGQYWKGQGGIYAGLVRGTNGQPDHHLIIAAPGTAGHFEGVKIGTYGNEISGANHRTDGRANTQAFAAAGSELCQQILELEIDDCRDWYLGADGELHLAYCNTPELFSKEGWYITSTQRGAHDVRFQYFEYGNSDIYYKDSEGRAVAFRRIQLSASVPQ